MKLAHFGCCDKVVALDYEWQSCDCPDNMGGMYNKDGDTVLVTKDARLIGLCNHLRYPWAFSEFHVGECDNAWPYPENYKVTRIDAKDAPTTYERGE